MPPTTTPSFLGLTSFTSRDPPNELTPLKPSLELPKKSAYSTNASTVKNRARIAKAKANDNAMLDFWKKKFKPAIQHVLDAQLDDASKATLEKSFRRQSNNAATAAWYVGIRQLHEQFMPPQLVQNAAKYRIEIYDDGTMTAVA
ncbi:unnamed protein product [Alternaria alternata]